MSNDLDETHEQRESIIVEQARRILLRLTAMILAMLMLGFGIARAQDSCVVRGLVVGCDGNPLPNARVRLIEPGLRSIFADRRGHFTVDLPCGVGRVLNVSGVHHEDLRVPILPTPGAVLEVEIRLRVQEWVGHFDSVRVIGNFNDYTAETAVPMKRRRDGTFVASVPCAAESLRYQLLGVAKDRLPTSGTLADTFFFRAGRSISSIRAGRKAVEVVFDPSRLPRPRCDAKVRISDPRAMTAAIYPLFRDDLHEDKRLSVAYQAHVAAGGDPDSFRWDWSSYVGALKRRISVERDTLCRQYLLLSCVRHPVVDPDSTLARRVLGEVPPNSPLWSLAPGGPYAALLYIASATRDSSLVRVYAERGSETHRDREMRAMFLSVALIVAQATGDNDRLGRYFTRMMDEFAGTTQASDARMQYAPNRATRVGQLAPEFAFSSLEDSTDRIRISSFRGRFLLLNFWAVWCGPCRAEMPQIHRAWEEFQHRGLAILSVSFDQRREDIVRYRKDRWPMPWLHAFASGGFASPESAVFEVAGIPKLILIGPDGVIAAEESDLRGDRLHETLARLLEKP